MLDLVSKAIETIITHFRSRADDKRKFMQEEVISIFAEMEIIHKNYIMSFTELIEEIEKAKNKENIVKIVLQKKMEFEHIRIKINSFVNIAVESESVPNEAKNFFRSIFFYFRVQGSLVLTTESKGFVTYSSLYSSLLEVLEEIDNVDNISESRNMLIMFLNDKLIRMRKNWELVTVEYSKCKLEMLK